LLESYGPPNLTFSSSVNQNKRVTQKRDIIMLSRRELYTGPPLLNPFWRIRGAL